MGNKIPTIKAFRESDGETIRINDTEEDRKRFAAKGFMPSEEGVEPGSEEPEEGYGVANAGQSEDQTNLGDLTDEELLIEHQYAEKQVADAEHKIAKQPSNTGQAKRQQAKIEQDDSKRLLQAIEKEMIHRGIAPEDEANE